MDAATELRQRVAAEVKRRRENGETLIEIGKSVGAHWNTVWHWEQGKKIGIKAISLLSIQPTDQKAA